MPSFSTFFKLFFSRTGMMAKSTLYIFLISAIFMLTCQHTLRNKFFGDSKINILYFSILYMYMYQSMKGSNNALFKSIFNNLFQSTIPDTTLVTEEIPGSFVPAKQLEAPSQIIVKQVKTVEKPAQGSAPEKKNNEAVVGVTNPKKLKRNNSNTNQSKSKRKKNARQKNLRKKSIAVNNAPTQLHVDTSDKKDHVSDDMEVPCLSDSESTVGSPTLSTISLPPDEKPHYYSLFSTGFDFGVSPNLTLSQEQKFHQTSHHLAFQNKVPSVENIGKRRSLLDMLDQDQQAQTTITPAAFSYFDEMMMSTSLYKFDQSQWQGFAR